MNHSCICSLTGHGFLCNALIRVTLFDLNFQNKISDSMLQENLFLGLFGSSV